MSGYDVIVVGGGLVGGALALALSQAGLRLALVEPAPCIPLSEEDGWDTRIYAVSPGNAALLKKLGVWDVMDQSRIAPIHAMHVWGDDGDARLDFQAYEAGVPELGFILESRLLQDALWRQLLQCGADVFNQPGSALELTEGEVQLALESGQQLHSRLLVGADGGASWARRQAGIGVTTTHYGQLGVVANFETEKPHGNVARQWFLPDGILAWLPLPGNRISIVWSAFEEKAQQLLTLNGNLFCETVADAGHQMLGKLRMITPPAAFPLRMQRNDSVIGTRLALVGDAAHLVHPLAGQGVNLGFRDVAALAGLVANRGPRDVGDPYLLRAYERSRQADVLSLQVVTTGLQKLFNNQYPILGRLRNAGLSITDRILPLKRQLMVHAIL